MANRIGSTICITCGRSTTIGINNEKPVYRSVNGECLACSGRRYLIVRRERNKLLYGNVNGATNSAVRIRNNERCRSWGANIKKEVIEAYGGKCALCGESTPIFLTIDHVNGDGFLERRQHRSTSIGASLYCRLRRLGWPKDRYRLLCYNCNMSLGFQNRHWSNSPNAIRVRVERLEFKLQVLNAYGGKCCCCGMNNPDMLSIDHIHGNGKVDRSIYGHFGRALYKHLRDNGYPKEDYRLLCYNCNEATHKLGVCPHEVCRLEAH